jgi:hypothetical protein
MPTPPVARAPPRPVVAATPRTAAYNPSLAGPFPAYQAGGAEREDGSEYNFDHPLQRAELVAPEVAEPSPALGAVSKRARSAGNDAPAGRATNNIDKLISAMQTNQQQAMTFLSQAISQPFQQLIEYMLTSEARLAESESRPAGGRRRAQGRRRFADYDEDDSD